MRFRLLILLVGLSACSQATRGQSKASFTRTPQAGTYSAKYYVVREQECSQSSVSEISRSSVRLVMEPHGKATLRIAEHSETHDWDKLAGKTHSYPSAESQCDLAGTYRTDGGQVMLTFSQTPQGNDTCLPVDKTKRMAWNLSCAYTLTEARLGRTQARQSVQVLLCETSGVGPRIGEDLLRSSNSKPEPLYLSVKKPITVHSTEMPLYSNRDISIQ